MTLTRRGALLLAASLCLTGLFAVAGCSTSPAAAPTMPQITALLARHAAAVRGHDRADYLADLDPAKPAAGFRSRQLAAYANLVKLPLTSWSYQAALRTDDRSAEQAASTTFGSSAVIVRLTLSYALRGVDPVPTQHQLWWTFVRHDGRVVVADDTGLAQDGGVSWQGPWDFGPLLVVTGSSSLVLGHPDLAAALPAIAATVDAGVPVVSSVWGTGWSRDVAVLVPSSAEELSTDAGVSGADITDQVAAEAVSDGTDPVSGTVYGQRLIVNPAALNRLSPLGRQITIRHEMTHIASAEATTDASPRWLVEGFADYVGNLDSGQPVTVTATELTAQVRRGQLPAALPAPAAFDTAGESAQAYEQAWLACRLIAGRIGPAGLVRFYRQVGASPDGSDTAVADALRALLHETTAQFTAQWRDYLRAQLG